WRGGAAFDAGVAGADHRAHARDIADAGNDTTALDVVCSVVIVHVEARKRSDLQKRRAAIEQVGETLARGELASLAKQGALRVGGVAQARFEPAKVLDECEHLPPIGMDLLRIGIDKRFKDRHAPQSSCRTLGSVARWKPLKALAGEGLGGRGRLILALGAAPSTLSVAPEMKAAPSESSNTIAAD